MKAKIFLVIAALAMTFSLSAAFAECGGNNCGNSEVIDIDIGVNAGAYAAGGGSGGVIKSKSKALYAPSQNANAIPTDAPRTIFIPDSFRKIFTEIGRYPYRRLVHFSDWDQVLDMLKQYQVKTLPQGDVFIEAIGTNQDPVTIESKIPTADVLYSFRIRSPLEAFHKPICTIGISVLKSFTHTRRATIIGSYYLQGRNMVSVIATRAGFNFMNGSSWAPGFGVGSNDSASASGNYTGWIFEFTAYRGQPTRLAMQKSGFYPIAVDSRGQIIANDFPALRKNISWLKANSRVLQAGAIIGFNVYYDSGYQGQPETLAYPVVRGYAAELRPYLGTTAEQIKQRFRITAQPLVREKTAQLKQLSAAAVVETTVTK